MIICWLYFTDYCDTENYSDDETTTDNNIEHILLI